MADYQFLSQSENGENTKCINILANELLSSASRTAGVMNNRKCKGVIFIITTANKANTPTFTPKILTYDSAGAAITLATFSAISTNATTILCYYPAVLTGFSGTEAKVGQLPRDWALTLTYAGTPANDKMDTKVDMLYLS